MISGAVDQETAGVIDAAAACLLGLRFRLPDQLFSNSLALFFRLRAKKSGLQDLNLRPHGPEWCALGVRKVFLD
jgi:hypothetical protein